MQLGRFDVPIASRDPWTLERLDANSGLLEDIQIGVGQAFPIFHLHIKDVNATLTQSGHPGNLYPVAKIHREGCVEEMSNANPSPGKYGTASRPMVLGSPMGSRKSRIPPKPTSLPLGSKHGRVRENSCFLGNENIST